MGCGSNEMGQKHCLLRKKESASICFVLIVCRTYAHLCRMGSDGWYMWSPAHMQHHDLRQVFSQGMSEDGYGRGQR